MWKKWKAWAVRANLVAVLAVSGGALTAAAAEQPQAPVRVSEQAVPAQIAFTSNKQLWILDGQSPTSKPVQVTRDGLADIVGWSPDGSWLLFLKYSGDDRYTSDGYLWAVKADGSGAFRVDDRSIVDKPKWSPGLRQFAYVVKGENQGDQEKPAFVIKAIAEDGKASLISTSPADFVDFAWMPDGKRLLVSTPAEKNQPMALALRSLTGEALATYPVADPPKVEEGIYGWAPIEMKVSPDGKLVAYYVQYNAASLSADGVPIQMFDLSQPKKKPVGLGTGLAYAEWLSWSPDSKQLAFIDGTDRMATQNKHLKLADANGKVVSASDEAMVDQLPVWTSVEPVSLYFTRGRGTEYAYDANKVMVPGQRIWTRTADGQERQVTKGTEQTADTYPTPSPDGKKLLYVRLNAAEHGSLYLSQDGRETEVLRNVTGDIGYYANYLPAWIRVFWKS